MNLIYYGNPILRLKCAEIKKITPEIKEMVVRMKEIMDEKHGIGIAAPQVGKSVRLFILRRYLHKEQEEWRVSEPYVYINPKILEYSGKTWIEEEGCLSIPGLRASVERPWSVKVEAQDLEGNLFVYEAEGENARAVFHENDHLNGTLYIDRIPSQVKKEIESKLRAIKNQDGGL